MNIRLWRTTAALLEAWLAEQPASGDVLNVLEDDAIVHPQLPALIQLLRQQTPPLDILLSEAFLTTTLYRHFRALERKRQRDGAAVLLLNGGHYLACSSSYLLSRDGAQRLMNAMRAREATGKLVPIDMALRQWIRKGTLSASISLPFFSTISAGMPSSIQHVRAAAVQLSQNDDLGLRHCYSCSTGIQREAPKFCGRSALFSLLASPPTSSKRWCSRYWRQAVAKAG